MLFRPTDTKLLRVRFEVTTQAIFIWIGLVAAAATILLLFGSLARYQNLHEVRRLSKDDRSELETVADKASEKAYEAAAAAEQAEAELAKAEQEWEAAWQAHTSANNALEEATAEYETVPVEVMSTAEQRQVSKAARDAFRRGELTEQQLRAVWQKVDGWDQAQQQRSAELSRMRVELADAWRRYHLASSSVRLARQQAEVAQVAARALRQEAADAAAEAEIAKRT